MAVQPDIDVEVLRCEIKKTYAQVSAEQETEFIFPTVGTTVKAYKPPN